MRIEKVQNYVREEDLGEDFSIWDTAFTPCTIMFHPSQRNGRTLINYCHFDEHNLLELTTFADLAKKREAKKIVLLGGRGSKNIPKLLGHLRKIGLDKITDYSLVSQPPIRELYLSNKGLALEFGKKSVSYSPKELLALFK